MSLFRRKGETAVLPMDVVPGQEPGVGGAPPAPDQVESSVRAIPAPSVYRSEKVRV